jgi:hypothetical protein
MTIFRWILVLPAAILFWVVADFAMSTMFNVIIFIGDFIHLSPIVDLISSPEYGGYQFVLFASFLAAVYGGSYVAPSKKKIVSLSLAALFILLRLTMAYSYIIDPHFTEDTPTQFIIGTITAICGAILGAYLTIKAEKPTKQAHDDQTIKSL